MLKFRQFLPVIVFGLSMAAASVGYSQDVPCDCPEPACKVCERIDGIDFYSDKCGPNLSQVKSCKKPKCVPVPNQNQCLIEKGLKPKAPVATSETDPSAQPAGGADRAVAGEVANKQGGDVLIAIGDAQVERAGGGREKLKTGDRLMVGDRVVTGEDGRVRVRLPEQSEIFVSPRSNLKIEEVALKKEDGAAAPVRKKLLLELMRGRVRSSVQPNTAAAGAVSSFEVKTKSAVAGVRGTDFVTTFEQSETEWKTQVQTLDGEVELRGLEGPKFVVVSGKTYASHIVQAPSGGESLEHAHKQGVLSPVLKMSDDQMRELMRNTNIDFDSAMADETSKRSVASSDSLCASPAGAFNQCSWTCEGNPGSEGRCRTDKPGVTCVRRLCRASGKWAEPTVLPPSDGVQCGTGKPVVGDCGNYW